MRAVYHVFERQGSAVLHAGVFIDLSPEQALARWLSARAGAAPVAVAAATPHDAWSYLVRSGGEQDAHYHYAVRKELESTAC